MNSKQALILLFVGYFSCTIQGMQLSIEEKLFNKKISPEHYLTAIQEGLYGEDLAHKMGALYDMDYASNNEDAIDLYQSLVKTIHFVIGPSGAERPSTIASFIARQIDAKYKMLRDYLHKNVLQKPSTSGSGEWA